MKRYWLISIILFLLFLPGTTFAKVYIDINSPSLQKFPIAIKEFSNLGTRQDTESLSQWFSDQLASMLSLTGYFTIIGKAAYLEPAEQNGLTSESIRFSDWSSIGAESLVKGAFQYDGKTLTCEFFLFDVVLGKLIAGKKYTGVYQERTAMVSRFANEILLSLTGAKGVFDTRIAFTAKYIGGWDLYTTDFSGSPPTRLTRYRALCLLPQWSPNGRQIAFTSYRSGNPDIYIIDADGAQEKKITTFSGLTLAGPWSADGHSILLTLSKDGKSEIYALDLQSRRTQPLTRDASINVSPSRSPDGRKIAFASDRSGSPQIFIMDADGGNVKRLTFDGNYNTSPRWSPRGDRIAYESKKNGSFQIMTIDPEGRSSTQLTTGGRNESPAWSPDGQYLIFVSTQKGKGRLCIVNANGGPVRVLHEGLEQYRCPAWSPHIGTD